MTDLLLALASIFGGVLGAAIGFALIAFVMGVLAFPYLASLMRKPSPQDTEFRTNKTERDMMSGPQSN